MPDTPKRSSREALANLARATLVLGLFWMGLDIAGAQTVPNPAALYTQHCATCHGEQRTGAMGPALLPESLERLRPAEALKVITQGRAATQMPGFADQLSAADIAALAAHIRTPVSPAPCGPRRTSAPRAASTPRLRASQRSRCGAPTP